MFHVSDVLTDYICEQCGITCNSSIALSIHVSRMHGEGKRVSKFICNVCSYNAISFRDLSSKCIRIRQ